MRHEPATVPPSWALPFLVLALILPAAAAFAAAGPQLGLAVGALEGGVVLVIAARSRFDRPIEVVEGAGYGLLLVALAPVEHPAQAARVAEMARAGALVAAPEMESEPRVLVLAPATSGRLARWATDVGESRFDAQRRLTLSLGTLAAAGIDARGDVGDPDPVQAIEDALRVFPASEVALVGAPPGDELLETVGRRAPLPVRTVGAPEF